MSDASNWNQKSHQISKTKPLDLEIWSSSRICEYVEEREITNRREVMSHRDLLQLSRNAAKFVWVRYSWARPMAIIKFNSEPDKVIREISFCHPLEFRQITIGLIPFKDVNLCDEGRRQEYFHVEFQRHWSRFCDSN